MRRPHRGWIAAAIGLLLAGCAPAATVPPVAVVVEEPAAAPSPEKDVPDPPSRPITLAFAGDVHFELQVAALLEGRRARLGPAAQALADADLAMVNLETAITERGVPDPKELEDAWNRYWFRAPASALDFLARSGVDVVSVANNHGADYGAVGLQDTLRAKREGPLAVVGVGRDRREAFTPYAVTVKGVDVAFLAADASPREGMSSGWSAGRDTPGLAAAHEPRPAHLLRAVRAADRDAEVVVVYLHWGEELRSCPTPGQRSLASALVEAGADVVVGSHAHVLLGAGHLAGGYVSYGLGNFVWYHTGQPETGVLRLRVEDGEVVSDELVPSRIGAWGEPSPLTGAERDRAVANWRSLGGCAGLAP
jgi:poly-gamma-glutamate capsule biosynthesis protein CapA/YwtB (metallophosphatase superfamily)